MAFKIFSGAVALTLIFGYLVPPILKLKEIDLGIVILLGLAMVVVDLWQSLKSKDD